MAQKSPAEAARELSIWLSSILLLTHANGNGEHDVATIHALSLMHEHGGSHSHGHSLNMDAMSGADDEAQLLIRATRFMLRNMRLFLLLIADPHDVLVQDAITMFLQNE